MWQLHRRDEATVIHKREGITATVNCAAPTWRSRQRKGDSYAPSISRCVLHKQRYLREYSEFGEFDPT